MTSKNINTSAKFLTDAQQRQFARMVQALGVAETKLDKQIALKAAAQEAHDAALTATNGFVIYCAEELNVPLGADGWTFNQAKLCFEQVKAEKEG